MTRLVSRRGRSALAVVIIACAVVFLVFGLLGSLGFVFSNGIGQLSDLNWGSLFHRIGREYAVDDTDSASLEGIDRIEIATVSTDPVILTGGTELAATLKGTCWSLTDPVRLSVEKSGSTLKVRIKHPPTGSTSYDLEYRITIPASYEGALSVAGVSAAVVLENPGFRCTEFAAVTVSGSVRVSGLEAESYDLSTTSGKCVLTGASGTVKARSVSGDIEVAMDSVHEFDADTVSGSAVLTLPSDADFDVSFHTVSGDLRCDFSLVLEKDTRTETSGRVGAGGPLAEMNSVSGDFRITIE